MPVKIPSEITLFMTHRNNFLEYKSKTSRSKKHSKPVLGSHAQTACFRAVERQLSFVLPFLHKRKCQKQRAICSLDVFIILCIVRACKQMEAIFRVEFRMQCFAHSVPEIPYLLLDLLMYCNNDLVVFLFICFYFACFPVCRIWSFTSNSSPTNSLGKMLLDLFLH